jgi:maltooligosyltrehalose trehalohydrolase
VKVELDRRTIGLNFADGKAEFCLWSPGAESVQLIINGEIQLEASSGQKGDWKLSSDIIRQGDLYQVKLNGDKVLPDPASLCQPEGVHGPSQAIDLRAYSWHDESWTGLEEENIFYELHTGTFSAAGTFKGISDRLGYLNDLGINTIEIMPVAQFPGERNWGYDGVYPFAVQYSYGGAAGLQKLVDDCHQHGLAIVLDVVYNHLGPEGNYLEEFGPYFTDQYRTPWGKAINLDSYWSDGVRQFFIENMLMWFRDFHIDGLRLDAVHAIKDLSARHFIRELREHADELEKITGRKYILIGETDLNDTRFIHPPAIGGFGLDKQWCDEFHHALHAFITGERNGYYSDFGELSQIVKAFNSAYVYDGIWSEHRKRTFGSSADGIPGSKFVVFIQNHDHIGNRMLGDRIGATLDPEQLKLLAGAMFVSPYIPLIFMGEEYNEENPFLYFTSHTDKVLAEAVSKGRKEEFPEFMSSGEFPEPQSEDVYERSSLTFDINDKKKHLFEFYRELIRLKKRHPLLNNYNRGNFRASGEGEKAILINNKIGQDHLAAVLNFNSEDLRISMPQVRDWHVIINSAAQKWGGHSQNDEPEYDNNLLIVKPSSIIIFSNIPADT